MKTICIIFFSSIILVSFGQTQIPEGGFENWTSSSLNTYYEPTGSWWTTLNTLTSLGGPVTASSTTDTHGGTHAAKLETKQWGTFLLPGLLVSGNFVMVSPYIKQGKPFSDKPLKFIGWYKYTSVSGDSAAIVAILTRFNTATGFRDTLATAALVEKNSVAVYSQFSIDFDYTITDVNPDSITVVFSSSADGSNFHGQVGSTLFIDDVSLEYTLGIKVSLDSEFTINVFPSPAINELSLQFNTSKSGQFVCKVYSMEGRFVKSFTPVGNIQHLDVSAWQQGKYIVQAWKDNKMVSSTKFVVAH